MNTHDVVETAKQMIQLSENSEQVIQNLREQGHGDVVDQVLADLCEEDLAREIKPHCDKITEAIRSAGEETGKSITVQLTYSASEDETSKTVRVQESGKVMKSPPFSPSPDERCRYHFNINGEDKGYHSLSGGCNWHFQGHAGFAYYSGIGAKEAEKILSNPDKKDSITFQHKGDEITISGPYEAE
jgi:hypothetical protein